MEICKLGQIHTVWKDYIVTIEFVEPQNLGVGSKFKTFDAPKAEISHKIGKMAAILEICKLVKTLKSNCGKLFSEHLLGSYNRLKKKNKLLQFVPAKSQFSID